MGKGGKGLPPRPTTYLLLFPPPTGWPPEAAEKKTIFVQNCQNFAAFQRLSRKCLGFVFYSPPFPPQKGGTCSPPWGSKNHSPPAEIWLIPLPVADPKPTYEFLLPLFFRLPAKGCSKPQRCVKPGPWFTALQDIRRSNAAKPSNPAVQVCEL